MTLTPKHKPFRVVPHVHPVVREMFNLANRLGMTRIALSERSGVSHQTLRPWEHGTNPRVDLLDACLIAVGYKLGVTR